MKMTSSSKEPRDDAHEEDDHEPAMPAFLLPHFAAVSEEESKKAVGVSERWLELYRSGFGCHLGPTATHDPDMLQPI
jgi:hypothetical protein